MEILSTLKHGAIVAAVLTMVGSASAADVRKISIGLGSSSLPGSVARIAKEMKLFEKHGLDATVTPMESGSVAMMGLLSGSLDFTTPGGTEVVLAQARGQDVVAIASAYGKFGAVVVLAKAVADKLGVAADAPVRDRLKALDGLLIASPAATSVATLALKPSAEAAGAKIRFSYMAQPAMIAALETGAIQGFIASAPFYTSPLSRGSGVIWINGPKGEFSSDLTPANYSVLNTRRDFAKANPDVIARVRAVFADFSKAAQEDPAAVKAGISKVFPNLDQQSLDIMFQTESPGFVTKPITVEDYRHEIQFLKANGQLPDADKLDPAKMILP